jgi:hypothetical protein
MEQRPIGNGYSHASSHANSPLTYGSLRYNMVEVDRPGG